VSRSVIRAAGAVIRRGTGPATQLLVLHRPKYDDWSFPKGKADHGEHIVVTALREVEEETGLSVVLRRPLPDRAYFVEGHPKVVQYWLAEPTGVTHTFSPNAEVDRLAWVSAEDASRILTQPYDQELVEPGVGYDAGTALLVVRHAKARKRSDWDGDDLARPLTSTGRAQAQALAALLGGYGVQRLVSSPAARCVATLQPFATAAGLPVEQEPTLTEPSFAHDPSAALHRVRQLGDESLAAGQVTAVCAHRPLLPGTVEMLLATSAFSAPQGTIPPAGTVVVHHTAQGVAAVELHTL